MIRGRLLVIEDDRKTREALQATFIRMGWEVVVVLTLAEGLAMLDDYDPNWVIVSSELPDGRDNAVLSQVRAAATKSRVALVIWPREAAHLAHLGPKADIVLSRPLNTE